MGGSDGPFLAALAGVGGGWWCGVGGFGWVVRRGGGGEGRLRKVRSPEVKRRVSADPRSTFLHHTLGGGG
eukprot:SAG11_NODE_1181_length_5595_cov_2.955604_4_plen_70_part_00